jgi:hypothetical protein
MPIINSVTMSAAMFDLVRWSCGYVMFVESRAAAAVRCHGRVVSRRGRGVIRQEGGAGHSLNFFEPSRGGNRVGRYGVSLNCFDGREVGNGTLGIST